MKTLIAAVAVAMALATALPSRADDVDAQKRADIEQLLEMTGALSMGRQMSSLVAGQYSRTLKQARPDIPPEVLDLLPQIIDETVAAHLDGLKDRIVPIYERHFTPQEIRELIAFYSTEIGRKVVRILPSILQESVTAGRQWGQSMMPELERRIRERFRQEGVEI